MSKDDLISRLKAEVLPLYDEFDKLDLSRREGLTKFYRR
jgi:hypothetical protein